MAKDFLSSHRPKASGKQQQQSFVSHEAKLEDPQPLRGETESYTKTRVQQPQNVTELKVKDSSEIEYQHNTAGNVPLDLDTEVQPASQREVIMQKGLQTHHIKAADCD